MKTILRNFLSAFRRFKMATSLNILGLSVAFAAFMVIMMQLDYDYNFDRLYTHSDSIYRVEIKTDKGAQAVLSAPFGKAFIESSPNILAGSICVLEGKKVISFYSGDGINSFEEEIVSAMPAFTDVFEFDMLYGTENALAYPEGILISESLSQKIFGEQSALDKTIKYDTLSLVVRGVYKDFPKNSLLKNGIYKPMPAYVDFKDWRSFGYQCFIRVDSPENSAKLIDNFKANFDASLLEDGYGWVRDMDYHLTSLPNIHFQNNMQYDERVPKASRQTLLILFAIAIIIIIIAAINFTNFSTALAPIRIKSINTQKVLGGANNIIRFSLIVEAITVSFISYLIALFFIYLIPSTPIISLLDVDPKITTYPFIVCGTVLLALFTGLIAGLYPAWYITSFQPTLVLKGSFGLTPKGKKLRNVLIGMQYVASFALIIGSLFMFLQNRYMQTYQLGYNKDRTIVVNINKPIEENMSAFVNKIKNYPEIKDISFAHSLISSTDQYWGRTVKENDKSIKYQCLVVEPNFNEVMDVKIAEGRDFREEDKIKEGGALLFNIKARDEYQLKIGDKIAGSEIIGFISDIKFASFRTEVVPMAFWTGKSEYRKPEYTYIKVKEGADMQVAKAHVANALNFFDNGYPFHIRFFDSIFESTYANERNLGSLIMLFSLIAIFISVVGVFGLVVFDSEYRRKEVGIRKVLGSTTHEIILLFNQTYVRILLLCFVLASPLAYYGVTKWLENFAYKTPLHWWVFAVAFIIVTIITVITVTFQNWRTANLNPVESIKTE